MPQPTSTQRSATAARLRRIAACLVQALVLVLCADVSGTLHAVLDVAVEAGMVAHPDDDCERDGHECPPGCLSCHCTHAASAWQAPLWSFVDTQLAPRPACAASLEYTDLAHASPGRGRIDRPPRA